MYLKGLAPLAQYPQWVVWRIEQRGATNTKMPYSPVHGRPASSTNAADWGSYEQAEEAMARGGYTGLGFVFTERDPFVFLDIDGAWDGSAWSLQAQELCARLGGAAVEVSQSGTGLHVIAAGAASLAGVDHRNKTVGGGLELYTRDRFVALTGTNVVGDASRDMSAVWPGVAAQYFKRETAGAATEWTTEPCAEWSGPADDGDLLQRALRSGGAATAASAFGDGPNRLTFADLFAANATALGAKWPHATGGYDASAADQSFANMLAFWTGRDCERMERLMRMSSLARPKWDEHATYLETTILKACGLGGAVYRQPVTDPGPAPQQVALDAAGVSARLDGGRMLYHQQVEHFAGCIYVNSINRVLVPGGDILDQARFNVRYGGYRFVHDVEGKDSTRSAWTAFTENEAFKPIVADRLCFRPEYGEGGLIRDGGKLLANTYYPTEPDDLPGDPSPFLNHLRRMLPYGDDFDLLVGWMATAIQRPGEKIQWWPVVQGAEGNFKSFLLLIMSHGVGSHYAHMPNTTKLVNGTSNFNGWIDRKLFLGLEEVYAANRREFFESFKTTVSNLTLPIEGKGIEETTGDNRANGMILTNHQDGVPVIGRSRRFAAFFCKQQTPEDVAAEGWDAAYIVNLKDWLLGQGAHAAAGRYAGIRIMAGYLRGLQVEARFNPLNMSRAPETTSTDMARAAGLGRVEQAILEAIEEERVGFAGGWVSSQYLNALLDTVRAPVPPNKRREMMQQLGYDYHPALTNGGRTTVITAPDNNKPRLYLRKGHLALNVSVPSEVSRLYTLAQAKPAGEATAAAFKETGK